MDPAAAESNGPFQSQSVVNKTPGDKPDTGASSGTCAHSKKRKGPTAERLEYYDSCLRTQIRTQQSDTQVPIVDRAWFSSSPWFSRAVSLVS